MCCDFRVKLTTVGRKHIPRKLWSNFSIYSNIFHYKNTEAIFVPGAALKAWPLPLFHSVDEQIKHPNIMHESLSCLLGIWEVPGSSLYRWPAILAEVLRVSSKSPQVNFKIVPQVRRRQFPSPSSQFIIYWKPRHSTRGLYYLTIGSAVAYLTKQSLYDTREILLKWSNQGWYDWQGM
jgi:hypothetical protein